MPKPAMANEAPAGMVSHTAITKDARHDALVTQASGLEFANAELATLNGATSWLCIHRTCIFKRARSNAPTSSAWEHTLIPPV
jgi:hypothetical protein